MKIPSVNKGRVFVSQGEMGVEFEGYSAREIVSILKEIGHPLVEKLPEKVKEEEVQQ